MTVETKCCEQVSDGGRWVTFHRCPRNAKVYRDGKPYCRQHDPEAVAARKAARKARWRIQHDRAATIRVLDLLRRCDESILATKVERALVKELTE